jgi:hypothetical protein
MDKVQIVGGKGRVGWGSESSRKKVQEKWAGERDVSNIAQLKAQADKWETLWSSTKEKWQFLDQDLDLSGIKAPARLSVKSIRDAARSFKKRTTAVEGWHPRHFGWLSDELLDVLSMMWHVCEVQLVWPKQEEELLAKLIPKASGGLRPILWFRSMYRVFARTRRPLVQEWFKTWAIERPEVNMAPGRHTTVAIWRALVRQETAKEGMLHVEWNWDLQKAFDHVDRKILWRKAEEAGYPMGLLATSLVSYGWSRRFILNREVSQEIKSGRGVAAGSPYGPYELAVYVDGLIHIVREWNKVHKAEGMHATLSIHVDDISVCISGKNGPALVRASGELARKLAFHVEGLGMKLDLGDKAFLMASTEALLVECKKAMGDLGGTMVQAVRKLGVDYAISARGKKNRKARMARQVSGKARWKKMCKMGLQNQGTRLVCAGILPHTTFGAALHAPSKADLAGIQCMIEETFRHFGGFGTSGG